uniref:Tail protein n=1 Tax=viral metagenome TaxID=1070528 RepID=A0A6M3JV65_9ZZZZ
MAEIIIKVDGAERIVRKIDGFSRALPGQIKKGFQRAGSIFIKDMRTKISGLGFSRNPARSSPYPGIKSGQMFRTLFMKVGGTATGQYLRVGPNVHYAVYQEFGTSTIPARPFVGPTLKENLDAAMDAIQQEIAKPLDR